MQLDELLEKYSIEEISQHTKISVENLSVLFEKMFDRLKRIQAMGFISILEREYGLDATALREEAQSYYDAHPDQDSIIMNTPLPELKEESNFPVKIVVLLMIALGVWYMSKHFDQQVIRNFFHMGATPSAQMIQSDATALGIGNDTLQPNKNLENE